MTSADIVQQLRTARPIAPAALRGHVESISRREPAPHVRLLDRLTARRRLLVAVPVAAAVVAAAAVGVEHAGSDRSREATPPFAAATDAVGGTAPGAELDAQTQAKLAAPGRAQSFSAMLALEVKDGREVSTAAQRAIAIADELGGFVVSSQVTTGADGSASIVLEVPFGRARDAVARLSALGTITSQDVRLQDLQQTLDTLDAQIRTTRVQLAGVLGRLAKGDLDDVERAQLEARRDALREQLRAARSGRAATAEQARSATIQLEVRSGDGSTVVPTGGRIDRILDRALEILAWEGAIAAATLVVAAPLLLLVGALWLARRALRRRDDERLLAMP